MVAKKSDRRSSKTTAPSRSTARHAATPVKHRKRLRPPAGTRGPEPPVAPASEKRLGTILRRHRLRQGLTLNELAAGAGISAAMLSRIETGAAAATLDTLTRLGNTLGIQLSALFREIEEPEGNAQVVKRGRGMEVVRIGTRKGYVYRLLAYSQGPEKRFEPFLITMDHESKVYPEFHHPGTEFIFVLEGRMRYRHGDKVYLLEPGDAMTFSGEVRHGPEQLLDDRIRFLDIIVYGPGEAP